MTEQQIQSKIIKKLEKEGWLVVKIIKCNKNGFPDLMALKDGIVKFFEVKRPTVGKLSPLQVYVQKLLIEKGFETNVVFSEKEIL